MYSNETKKKQKYLNIRLSVVEKLAKKLQNVQQTVEKKKLQILPLQQKRQIEY